MLPEPLLQLIELLARLPGVGEKTAQRFAMYLVAERSGTALALGHALTEIGEKLKSCDRSLLCIVARVQDLLAIERSGAMRGRYFVLGRLLSPLDGIGPDELPLETLKRRLDEGEITEVVVATPPSVDGEATALLLARELGGRNVRVSRIASGVPHGGDLEFADQITLGRAIAGRKDL